MPFGLFIVAVIVAGIITYLYATAKRNLDEFRYMAERCTEHVKGTVSQVQPTGHNSFRTIFTVTENEEEFEIPYFRDTAENTFVRNREYDLYIDRELLDIAMTEADKDSVNNTDSLKTLRLVAGLFIAIFALMMLYFFNPDMSYVPIILSVGAIFYLVAAFIEKRDVSKMEKTTYLTEATIIDYQVKSDDDGTSYFPIYRYRYGDQEYEAVSEVSRLNAGEFHRNQEVQIRLDPDDPQNSVIIALEKRGFKITKWFKIIGIGLIILGLAVLSGIITLQ